MDLKFESMQRGSLNTIHGTNSTTLTQLIFPATSPCNSPSSLTLTPTIPWAHMLHYSLLNPPHRPLHSSLHICYFLCWNIFLYPVHLAKDQLSILFDSFLSSFVKVLHEKGKYKITGWMFWVTSWRKIPIGNVVGSQITWKSVTFPCIWSLNVEPKYLWGISINILWCQYSNG